MNPNPESTKFFNLLKAGYACLWVQTHEEDRCISELRHQAKIYETYSWDLISGLKNHKPDGVIIAESIPDPLSILMRISTMPETSILFLKDFHKFIPGIEIFRALKNAIPEMKARDKHVVIVSPVIDIPLEMEKDITVFDFDLPTVEDLIQIAHRMVIDNEMTDVPVDEQAIAAAKGLTLMEAEDAMAFSLITKKKFDREVMEAAKLQAVKKSGLMELYLPEPEENLGGLEPLKQYLHNRKDGFFSDSKSTPKGILLTGVPGGGKSLSAKVTAAIFNLPILKLDFSSLKGSLQGESDRNIRRVTQLADAIGSCVLFMDEVEKALGGVASSNHTDGGTTASMFGHLLTWMQETKSRVYIVATCLSGETIIQLSNGTLKSLKSFNRGPIVCLKNSSYGKIIPQGIKPTIKINTSDGTLICTADHPIFTTNEEGEIITIPAGEISPGDLIVSTLTLPEGDNKRTVIPPDAVNVRAKKVQIPESLTDDLAYLLGYLCGDGGAFNNRKSKNIQRIQWSEESLDLSKQLVQKISNVFGVNVKIHKKKDVNCYYSYLDSVSIGSFFEKNFPEVIISGSEKRAIPEAIHRLNNKGIAAFLSGLFDAEGHLTKTRAAIALTSENVIKQTILLLKRLDIQSTYNERGPIIPRQKVYKLTISDQESLNNFSKQLILYHPKKEKMVFNFVNPYFSNGCRNVPNLNSGIKKRLSAKKIPLNVLPNFKQKTKTITKAYSKIYLNILDEIIPEEKEFLDRIKQAWALKHVPVKSVSINEEDQQVYDINIQDDSHAFLANGLLVHNCNDMEPLLTISQGALLRRFDDIFFVDVPSFSERCRILEIMNARYGTSIDDKYMVKAENWTGAEIEKFVKSSIYDGEEFAFDNVHPIYDQNRVIIEKARDWAKVNARRANMVDVAAVNPQKDQKVRKLKVS